MAIFRTGMVQGALTLVAYLLLAGGTAWAYPTYTGCAECHGAFASGSYTSLVDGTNWGGSLIGTHQGFVSNRCNACHNVDHVVYTNQSDGTVMNRSCGNAMGERKTLQDHARVRPEVWAASKPIVAPAPACASTMNCRSARGPAPVAIPAMPHRLASM